MTVICADVLDSVMPAYQPSAKSNATLECLISTRNDLEKQFKSAGEKMWRAEQDYLEARTDLRDIQQKYDEASGKITRWYSDLLLTSQRLNK